VKLTPNRRSYWTAAVALAFACTTSPILGQSEGTPNDAEPVPAGPPTPLDLLELGSEVCGCMDVVFVIDVTESLESAIRR
jgi:hypothetical protein